MRMPKFQFAVSSAAVLLFAALPAFSQNSENNQGKGTAIVTVLPAHGSQAPQFSESKLSLQVDGKATDISEWQKLQGSNAPIQLVILIDEDAGQSIANQFSDIKQFANSLPSTAEVAVAYMRNGRANFAGPLSKDHAAVAKQLHMPSGPPGISGSPYFCLSDLAHNWPSQDRTARRVVVMITDGVDNYEIRYNPEDPYLQAAIHDAVHSRISVYSMYWRSRGEFSESWYAASDGQNLLSQLTKDTGGFSYWQGAGNPVSLQPYFKNLGKRLNHQYRMSFNAPIPHGPGVETMHLKVNGLSAKVVAPQRVYVGHPAPSTQGE